MIELILLASLSGLNAPLLAAGPFQPCVWPNRCAVEPAPALAAGPFQTCVWPNTCGSQRAEPVLAAGPFQPCVWPNRCRADVSSLL